MIVNHHYFIVNIDAGISQRWRRQFAIKWWSNQSERWQSEGNQPEQEGKQQVIFLLLHIFRFFTFFFIVDVCRKFLLVLCIFCILLVFSGFNVDKPFVALFVLSFGGD